MNLQKGVTDFYLQDTDLHDSISIVPNEKSPSLHGETRSCRGGRMQGDDLDPSPDPRTCRALIPASHGSHAQSIFGLLA